MCISRKFLIKILELTNNTLKNIWWVSVSTLFNILLGVVVVGGIFYLLKKKGAYQKPKHVAVIDPEAQAAYNVQKVHTEEKQSLSLEEKIKLSWQFLVNLKKQIVEKFSQSDKEKLAKASQVLVQNGMNYQHDVDLEVKLSLLKVQSVDKSKKQEQSQSISM